MIFPPTVWFTLLKLSIKLAQIQALTGEIARKFVPLLFSSTFGDYPTDLKPDAMPT
jgi:hypothetical protein